MDFLTDLNYSLIAWAVSCVKMGSSFIEQVHKKNYCNYLDTTILLCSSSKDYPMITNATFQFINHTAAFKWLQEI